MSMSKRATSLAAAGVAALTIGVSAATIIPANAAGPVVHQPSPLTPVQVYIGGRLTASGLRLSTAIKLVRPQTTFPVYAPAYTPPRYSPLQLAVTPTERGVSGGYATTTYGVKPVAKTNTGPSIQIAQAANGVPVVGGKTIAVTLGGAYPGTLHEFKTFGHDLLILAWSDGTSGFTVSTDAALSHLSAATIVTMASSLRAITP